MSYNRRSERSYWLVVRRKGTSPIRVVRDERYKTKRRAEKEAMGWNKLAEGSAVEFLVRKEGWRRKRWYF